MTECKFDGERIRAHKKGDQPRKIGKGMLVTVVFGYLEKNYEMSEVVSAWYYSETYWIDAAGNEHLDLDAFALPVSGGR